MGELWFRQEYLCEFEGTIAAVERAETTAKYAHVLDMAKKNPALSIPAKVG